MRILKIYITLIISVLALSFSYAQPGISKADKELRTKSIAMDSHFDENTWQAHTYLKTNLLGLGAAVANLSFEVDLGKHWSFNLPVYYSAWDYFTSTVKFRTFAVQPEFRFWTSKQGNNGLFVGAHFGMAYYNLALDGRFRYQDRNGDTPAIGGGMSLGYRMPLGKASRWKMEFSMGVGYYPLEYDLFQNVRNGALSHYEKRKYLGIDQATISLVYMLNRNKQSK
ncbi:MAG: DUF3575 domain-containing protein [Alistipes sp.]|nr:DUF3575 domain-containing protein [Alistipes sp.]